MPNSSIFYDGLGEAYFQSGHWDSAIKHYAKSLALDPNNENAIKMIAEANTRRKEINEGGQ
jgi:cytochrome c-type biogenesis protein CcmH/NrfG